MLEATLLVPPVSVADHARGNRRAPVTLVVFGDYGCHYSRRLAPTVASLLRRFGPALCLVYRHAPHAPGLEHASPAALAAEAAAVQGRFWEMHDALYAAPGAITEEYIWGKARELGLDFHRFDEDRRSLELHRRLYELATSAARSGVVGTPMVFLNGHRVAGALDEECLGAAVAQALDEARRGREVVCRGEASRSAVALGVGAHSFVADLPVQDGGEDAGPGPMELLFGALAACTATTLISLARRRSLPLEDVVVRVRALGGESPLLAVARQVDLIGPLTDAHKALLREAAEVTPVTLAVRRGLDITTSFVGGAAAAEAAPSPPPFWTEPPSPARPQPPA